MKKNDFKDTLVVITGAGYRKANKIFHCGRTCDLIEINRIRYKLNVGAATAKAIVEAGARVCIVSQTEEKLKNIKEYIINETGCKEEVVSYKAVNLLNEQSVKELHFFLDKEQPVWFVHSVGLGAQTYQLNGDNPYIPFTEIQNDIPTKEFDVVVKSLLITVKTLLPIFREQEETRIVVVTSMSGIRPYMYGYSHASAKAGIHHATRSLALEFNYREKSIYVTEILPGIIDTGLYDSESVVKSVQEIGETFGFSGKKKYNEENFPLMSPSAVAEAIVVALTSEAHILSINMVAHGQFPHM